LFLVSGIGALGGPHERQEIFFSVFFLVMGGLNIRLGVSPTRFAERGVLASGDLFEWERVESWKWQGADRNVLTLRSSRGMPLFRALNFPVPADQKEAVEQLLAQYVHPESSCD